MRVQLIMNRLNFEDQAGEIMQYNTTFFGTFIFKAFYYTERANMVDVF